MPPQARSKLPLAGWVGETDARAQTTSPTLDELSFPAMELYAMPAASEGDVDSRRASSPADQSKLPQAPVGHRQPTAADIPKDLPKNEADIAREKRDRDLDAKLRICRNC